MISATAPPPPSSVKSTKQPKKKLTSDSPQHNLGVGAYIVLGPVKTTPLPALSPWKAKERREEKKKLFARRNHPLNAESGDNDCTFHTIPHAPFIQMEAAPPSKSPVSELPLCFPTVGTSGYRQGERSLPKVVYTHQTRRPSCPS